MLIIFMISSNTTMAGDGTTDEGALWFARMKGRAGDLLLHVIDRLEQ